MRLGGNVIWCTQFKTVHHQAEGRVLLGQGVRRVEFDQDHPLRALLRGGVLRGRRQRAARPRLGRRQHAWISDESHGHAFYNGNGGAACPTPIMESIEGTGNVPAYRGTAYLDLRRDHGARRLRQPHAADHGRDHPQRRRSPIPNDLTNLLRSVALLPGAGEFVLATTIVKSSDGFGNWYPRERAFAARSASDIQVSLHAARRDAAEPFAAVSLVVTWFGSDLRAGSCQIVPKVETHTKTVTPASAEWAVAGYSRAIGTPREHRSTRRTSILPGLAGSAPPTGLVPAFGGTPSDQSVSGSHRRPQGHRGASRDVLSRSS